MIGVDDYTSGSAGSVRFFVYGDGSLLYFSDVKTGADDAEEITVDVTGVQVLKLEVTDAGNGKNNDHADWANTRLTTEPIGGTGDEPGGTVNPSAMLDSIRYAGEYYDAETGFIYLRNRYYDPEQRRFITEDPIRDGANWYIYCGNNPVNRLDPFGLDSYILYDPDIFGEGSGTNIVMADKRALEEYYGTTCHLIPIYSKEGFVNNWNNKLGAEGDGTIDAVMTFSHSYWSTLIFGKGNAEYTDVNIDTIQNELNSKTMKVLILAGCNAGETDKNSNLATTMLKKNNVNMVIAADGQTLHIGGENHTQFVNEYSENGSYQDGYKRYLPNPDGPMIITKIGRWFMSTSNILNAAYATPGFPSELNGNGSSIKKK